jgi:hypothetical protein
MTDKCKWCNATDVEIVYVEGMDYTCHSCYYNTIDGADGLTPLRNSVILQKLSKEVNGSANRWTNIKKNV